MRYLAADVYAVLKQEGCTYEGDAYEAGVAWLGPVCQVFFLPDPDLIDGKHWFDADVIDDNLRDRWIGFTLIGKIKRHQ